MGDLLFAAVNLARKLEVEPETALRRATAKFERRFRRVAALARERGVRVSAGADFDPAGRDIAALRLSLSRIARGALDEAGSRLAAALRDVQARSETGEAGPPI